MPLPDRPVAGADIETLWGQEVHDYTFAPKGAELTTATTRTVDTTAGGFHCHLDVAVDDPAGFLDIANDQAVVPSGAEGLYLMILRLDTVNGDVGTQTRAWIYLNGATHSSGIEDNNGGTHVIVTVPVIIALTAGDIVRVYAQRKGTGTNPTVFVKSLHMVRLGAEYGA